MPAPPIALPSDLSPKDELSLAILQLGIDRRLGEATLAVAIADALGHLCATLDLQEGRRDFPRRAGAFLRRTEETYRRSLLRNRTGLTDVHGRPI